jgi:hypothetical protein
LPAYVKGLLPYQANRYAGLTRMEFRSYVLSHWHLFVLIAFGIALGPREWWRRVSSAEKGILVGTAFFLYYHYRFVLPVMGYSQRFNYPTLPALIYLGAVGLLRLVDFVGRQDTPGLRETRRRLLFWGSVGLSICLLGRVAWSEWTSWLPGVKGTFGRFVWTESPEGDQMDYVWPSLAAVARLPDSLVIAATEVGLVGALNPGKQVIDLAGLNETAVAHNLIEGAALLRERHPDLIYMPHPDHQKLLRDIALDPYLQAHYDFFSWPTSFLGVAVWRDSPHYARMRAILTRRSAPRHAPPDSGTLSGAGEPLGGPGLEQGR